MVTAAQQEERRNDIFCPRLANPQDTSKLETLMTTNNAQMVKLWGHTGPSDAAQAPCGIALHARSTHTGLHAHTHREEDTRELTHGNRLAGSGIHRSRDTCMHDAGHTQCAHKHTLIT